MAADKKDYDELVKDHVRMRLMESGWTDKVGHMVRNAVRKRAVEGQATKTIQFEQIYNDVVEKARDAVPDQLEVEFHEKIGHYLSAKQDEAASSSFIPSSYSPCDHSNVLDIPSNTSKILSNVCSETVSKVPFDDSSEVLLKDYLNIPSKVISTEVSSEVIPTEVSTKVVPTEVVSDVISTEAVSDVISTEAVSDVISTEAVSDVISTEDASEVTSSGDAIQIISTENASEGISTTDASEIIFTEKTSDVVSTGDSNV